MNKQLIKNINKRFFVLLFTYILLSLVIVFVAHLFISEREKAYMKEAETVFLKSIEKEKVLYIKTFVFKYNPQLSSNSISGEEKKNWGEQKCLISDDPHRYHLDSIFQAELANRKVYGAVGIRCAVGDKVATSRPEWFYKKAMPLDVVSYRKDTDKKQDIILQPYIHLSYWWLVNCWPVYILLAIWGGCTVLFIYMLRKNRRQFILSAPIDEKQGREIVHKPTVKIRWTLLPGNISFDVVHGILKQKDTEVSLYGDSLVYFRSFLQRDNYMLTYQDILENVYGVKIDEISRSDRSKISHGIERLQKQLECFENIKIVLVRGKGYQMAISSENS